MFAALPAHYASAPVQKHPDFSAFITVAPPPTGTLPPPEKRAPFHSMPAEPCSEGAYLRRWLTLNADRVRSAYWKILLHPALSSTGRVGGRRRQFGFTPRRG